ncbi:MAG: hypothetical protein Q7S76_04355, partial [bacterium]|nr:hypothetical protein [bacterium]
LAMASEIDACTHMTAQVLGRVPEYLAKAKKYDLVRFQFSLAMQLRQGEFARLNDKTRAQAYKTAFRLAKKQYDIPVRAEEKLLRDVDAVAQDAVDHFSRYQALAQAIESDVTALQGAPSLIGIRAGFDTFGRLQFPYDVFFRRSEVKNRARSLLDVTAIRTELKKRATEKATERGVNKWRVISFTLLGMSGYAVVNNKDIPERAGNQAQELTYILEMIHKHTLSTKWGNARAKIGEDQLSAIEFDFKDIAFFLTSRDYQTQSLVEAYLDLHIPESVREGTLDRLRNLTMIRPAYLEEPLAHTGSYPCRTRV